MTMERRIQDAMRATAAYEPSPDLFAKVQKSIDQDKAHRRRVRNIVLGVVVFVVAIASWFAVWWNPQPDAARLPWWSIVTAAVIVEIAVVVIVGPAIRRFGSIYADDIFRTCPETGGRFLALLDVAYYLVFVGVVAISIPLEPDPAWSLPGGVSAVVQEEAVRVAARLYDLRTPFHGTRVCLDEASGVCPRQQGCLDSGRSPRTSPRDCRPRRFWRLGRPSDRLVVIDGTRFRAGRRGLMRVTHWALSIFGGRNDGGPA